MCNVLSLRTFLSPQRVLLLRRQCRWQPECENPGPQPLNFIYLFVYPSLVFQTAIPLDFLVVQWLSLCTPDAGSLGSIPSL